MLGFGYNPASQLATTTRSNDAYAWTAHYNVNRPYTANGLNQYTLSGAITPTYDGRGNLRAAGGPIHIYTSDNLLSGVNGVASLAYDPLRRLIGVETAPRFGYDGVDMISEHNSSNVLQRRYVHGPGADEPLVWYEGSGTTDRRWLHADERGSVITVTNASGAATILNSYDEYGIPGAANQGRFQYTGQAWLSEFGLYHYKARTYSPTLGRFLQTDPIGYGDGMNMYAYTGNDPVNGRDPSGTVTTIEIAAKKIYEPVSSFGVGGWGGSAGGNGGETNFQPDQPDIEVVATQMRGVLFGLIAWPQSVENGCASSGASALASVAEWADLTADVADVGALGAAGLGLVLAPTGAGGIGLGITAIGLKGVSLAASGVAISANYFDGNTSAAVSGAGGFAVGALVGRQVGNSIGRQLASTRMFGSLSASQIRQRDLAEQAAGAIAARASCIRLP